MDTDVYYDIPIYKTLPSIIRNNEYSKKDIQKVEINDISIEKIYQLEPFNNYKKNYIILFFFIIIIYFLIIIYYKK